MATEEDFNKLDGFLRLVEQESEETTDENPIGWLSYTEEYKGIEEYLKASYTVNVNLPKRRFEALLTAVNKGRLPSEISITTEGMSYDWQPDGSGKIWDNKTTPQIPIKSMDFIVPLVGRDPLDFLDDRNEEDGMAPSRAQLNQVTTVLNELGNRLDSMHRKLFWLVILMVVMLAVLLWRYL